MPAKSNKKSKPAPKTGKKPVIPPIITAEKPPEDKPAVEQPAAEKLQTELPPATLPEVPSVSLETPLKLNTVEKIETENREEEVPLERKNKILYYAGIASLAATFSFLVLIYFFLQKEQKAPVQVESIVSPTVAAPTTVTFNPSDWTIAVENGSGTAGVAKKAADALTQLGFRITSTGNADKPTYRGISVWLSPGLSKYQSQFLDKISSIYKEASLAGSLSTSSPSARIIIGK